MRLIHHRRPPHDLVAGLPLAPEERPLAWAPLAGGGAAVATTGGLWLTDPGGSARRDWTEILYANWDPQSGSLGIEALTAAGRERYRLRLADAGQLPETVRDRVTASILVSRHVPLGPDGGVRLVARRAATGEGAVAEVRWQLVYDDGVDDSDPAVAERAGRELERLRSETGL